MRQTFAKPAKTLDQQVELLTSRGLVIPNAERAAFYLGEINYYRLRAYWLPFEADHATHQFQTGTTFDQVLDLYIFDRKLRLLLMDSIERAEVAVRTRWAYEMAHRHGPHAHMDPGLSRSFTRWSSNISALGAEIERSREVFIEHYQQSYELPELPPVWAVCEVMSLGLLSRWYTQLGPMATRSAIAGHFGLDQQQFEGLLEHLAYVRNLCAHHSRTWNRRFTKAMPLPRHKPSGLRVQMNTGEDRLIYNTLVILLHLVDAISPGHHWRQELLGLLQAHPDVPIAAMGFRPDYRQLPIWQ